MPDGTATPRLDDQQRRAVETLDRSVAVVAGAGTGKTTVLVERFIALLDAHPDWPVTSIVAITFTERAAEEMRARVRRRILDRLANSTGADRRRWAEHLARIEAARISTIHGMCSEIIRANAMSAGVDPAFQVADAATAAVLRRDAVSNALRDIARQSVEKAGPDTEAALAVLTRYDTAIIEEVLQNVKAADGMQPPPDTVEQIEAMFEQEAEALLTQVCASAAAHDVLSIDTPPSDDAQGAYVRDAQASLRMAADRSVAPAVRVASLKALRFNRGFGKADNWPSPQHLRFAREAMTNLQHVLKLLEVCQFDRDREARALQYARGWHVLVNRVLAAYDERKHTENVLDFDDLEFKAEALLARPEIRSRYAGREIRHVMVDEFQDTNHRQWNIARGLAPDLTDGGVFIVGDPKQSIYRFRGADATIFKAASDEIAGAGGLIVHMNRSYRTHDALIAQMNRMFRSVMQPPLNAWRPDQFVAYDDDHALIAERTSPTGAIDVQLIEIDLPSGATQRPRYEARVVAAEIREMVATKRLTVIDPHTRQPRPAGFGDFAVLLQSFKSNARYFEQAFVDFDIPYMTQSGGGFYDRREIRDLIELLKALRNPADDLALAAALHSPLFGLSDVNLLTLRSRGGLLCEALEDEAVQQGEHESLEHPIVFAHRIFAGLQAIAGHVSADTLLSRAIADTNYLASVGRLPDGKQIRANVEKLIDLAREHGSGALPDFIAFLDASREAEDKEGAVPLDSGGAVRLTTIHGCKGLEYPVVWLANATLSVQHHDVRRVFTGDYFACRLPKLGEESADGEVVQSYLYTRASFRSKEAAAAEAQRLLYVAATRARDALFISSSRNSGSVLHLLSAALDDATVTNKAPSPVPTRRPTAQPRLEDTDFPLAETQPAAPPAARRSLTATNIADYGGWLNADTEDERAHYWRRIARQLRGANADPVETLTYDAHTGMPSPRRIGALVHRALLYRVDRLMKTDRERADHVIESLVWEAGITLPAARRAVVDHIRTYVRDYIDSPLAQAVEQAKAVYRELPFVVERDGQLVHGTIDLVYVDPADRWHVVDFKTDVVPNDRARITAHARRYLLQLAVYAAALRERVGAMPTAQIVYLRRPQHIVTLRSDELERELEALKLSAIAAHLDESSRRS